MAATFSRSGTTASNVESTEVHLSLSVRTSSHKWRILQNSLRAICLWHTNSLMVMFQTDIVVLQR